MLNKKELEIMRKNGVIHKKVFKEIKKLIKH